MSGSFERQIYDQNAYQAYLRQSTGPLIYQLDPVRVARCNPCRQIQPGFNNTAGVSHDGNRALVDIESNLMRLNYRNSKDPNAMYKPSCTQCGRCLNEGLPCGCRCNENLIHLPECSIITDHTRLSNPIWTARELGINRFQPLCLNPQDEGRWHQRAEIGINYRMVVKDNHVPLIPKPLDQSAVLPTGQGPAQFRLIQCMGGNDAMHGLYKNLDRNWNA